MDRLSWMTSFVAVAETGGITSAALRERVSKAVVSKHLAQLEEHLHARLLHRTTRRLHLTEVGEVYYQQCVRILADLTEAEQSARDLHGEPRGRLRLSAPMSFGQMHLAPALGEFLVRYPEITIEMVLNDRFVDLVEEGFDLAVRIGRLSDSTLMARRLAPNRLVTCASPDYLARHPAPRHPGELVEHDCLLYGNMNNPKLWRYQGAAGEVSVTVRGRLEVNNGDVLREMAIKGLGVVILPTFLVGRDIQSGVLLPLLPEYALPETAVHAVYPQQRHASAKVRAFVTFLVERFGPKPYWDVEV